MAMKRRKFDRDFRPAAIRGIREVGWRVASSGGVLADYRDDFTVGDFLSHALADIDNFKGSPSQFAWGHHPLAGTTRRRSGDVVVTMATGQATASTRSTAAEEGG